MKKQVYLFALLGLLAANPVAAQEYVNGLGGRLGYTNGVTFKHFFNETGAIEGIFSSKYSGFLATGVVENHFPLAAVPHLYGYYGGGVHVGFWNAKWGKPPKWEGNDTYTVAGIDGILGMEYMLESLPLSFAMDWKPAVHLIGPYNGYFMGDAAISIRYTFK